MDCPVCSVAFYMHDLSGGGVERMRLALIRELTLRGHDVTLIVQNSGGALCAEVPTGPRLITLGTRGVVASAVALARVLRRLRPQFLISSLDHNNISAMCAGILSGGRTHIVICQHNALSAERALGWKYRAVPLCYRLLSPFAAAIVAVSFGVANDLAAVTGIARRRITVIANPVLDSTRLPRRQTFAPRQPAMDSGAPIFVFIGRLVAQKDPYTLLAAFARRLRARPARLVLLGEGILLPELRAMAVELGIAQHVEFAGFVADPTRWLTGAHALVMTSRYEGFGNVLVEAMACGTPVIATDCPHGPAEILGEGQFGRLVPVGDVDALALAMQEDLRCEFPARLLQGRAAAFTVTACADSHERIFATLGQAETRPVFGLAFTRLNASSVAGLIVSNPSVENLRLVVTPNSEHIRLLQRPAFAAAYRTATLVCADGEPVALYAWLRGAAAARRVTGCDIFHEFVRHPALAGLRVFTVVESNGTEAAVRRWLLPRGLSRQWHVATAPAGLAGDAPGAHALVAAIRSFRPNVLILTLGAPVSEEFAYAHRADLPSCWVLCVGQAVRVELGLVRRAPGLMRVLGLEWLWRALCEPRRLLPRYAAAALWLPRAIYQDLAHANGR